MTRKQLILTIAMYLVCMFFLISSTTLTMLVVGARLDVQFWGHAALFVFFGLAYFQILVGSILETIENS